MGNKNKKFRRLPEHSNEAHPSACAGEVNKQFVIAIIAVAAIVVLALLLLFSGQFVGKAIYGGAADTGGIVLVSPKAPLPVLKNEPFTLNVGVNLKGKTKIISFTLILPQELNCSGVTVKNVLPNVFQSTAKCENNKIIYEYYTLGIGDNLASLSGAQDLAEITFSLGAAVGPYELTFEKMNYFDLDLKQEVNLNAKAFSLEVKECPEGKVLCGGQCVDLQTDKKNCGQCSAICKDLESCALGKCVAQCTGETPDNCNNVCVNLKTGMENCGECGKICNLQACVKGMCIEKKCSPEEILCNNECVNTETDMKNCGGCGQVCDSQVFQTCKGGQCIEIKKCGNEVIDGDEQCDDPKGDSSGVFTQNCIDLGFNGGKIKCTNDCRFDTSECGPIIKPAEPGEGAPKEVPTCGNGMIDGEEECDSPPDNSGVFTKNCNTLGFDGGLIQCKNCKLDTSKCNPKPQPVAVEQGAAAGAGEVVPTPVVAEGAAAGGALPAAGAGAGVAASGAVQQTKISLAEVTPLNNAYSTLITATEDFTTEVTVYTVLYGDNNKVLSIKLEKIEGGLKKGTSYTATVSYPLGGVKKKSVIVYDVELKPTVYGKLDKEYTAISG